VAITAAKAGKDVYGIVIQPAGEQAGLNVSVHRWH
jgi:hypothetical protein